MQAKLIPRETIPPRYDLHLAPSPEQLLDTPGATPGPPLKTADVAQWTEITENSPKFMLLLCGDYAG